MADSIKQLQERARSCRACPLWANATQTVFGAGDPHAKVMLVGEQPGNDAQQSAFPHSVRSHHYDQTARRYLETNVAQHRPDSVMMAHIGNLNHRHLSRLSAQLIRLA